jgi:hypothetical protein
MSDTKISALPAVVTPATTDEFPINQSNSSKKMTVAQMLAMTPTAPTVRSVTAAFSGTGAPTATLPTGHALNDILLLVLQTSNDSQVTAPTGYTQLGPQNGVGDAASAGATKLCVFWKRDNGSESVPTIPDTGDHTYGFMAAIKDCPTTGDPFCIAGQNWKFTASTTGTASKGVAPVDNCLVLNFFAHAWDNTTDNVTGSGTNEDLTDLTKQFSDSTSDGTGGGLVMISGTKATRGEYAATTVVWANSTVDVSLTITMLPVTVGVFSDFIKPVEVQVFIGSSANLDDLWVKPSEARFVRVQLVDGGGGGSSGNTTTTAAGGGGGGGGGYDEANYLAFNLSAASYTVHAGKGGAATTALNQAGNPGVISEFDKGGQGPLTSARRIAGTAATAAASADGGNGGCGSGVGTSSPAVQTTRRTLNDANAARAVGASGAPGGSGTTAPVGGSEAHWGGGGGESGGDTDAAITSANNGNSMRGGGGGAGGRTNGNISGSGAGGGAAGTNSAQGAAGIDSTRLPFGGSGGCGGGTGVAAGGAGGFPGGGGGGGGGVANGNGGRGGHGIVVVTTIF